MQEDLPKLKVIYMDNMLFSNYYLYPRDDLYFRISRIFMGGDVATDRFNVLHDYSKYRWTKIESQRPKLTGKNFVELCVEHAQELIAKYNKIGVTWSGGVDSTGVVFALLEAGIPVENLLIIGSLASIEEAPTIYEYFKRTGLRCKIFDNSEWMFDAIDDLPDLDIVLTGNNNDQLFYRGRLIKRHDRPNHMDDLQRDWKDGLRFEYRNRRHALIDYLDTDIALLENYQKELDWHCDTWAELSNMANFCFHWEYCKYYFTFGSRQNKCSKVKGFYMTQDMQDWAYTNRKRLAEDTYRVCAGDFDQYKPDLKKLIYKYTGCEEYLKTKLKCDSVEKYKGSVNVPYIPFGIVDTLGTRLTIFKPEITGKQYVDACVRRLDKYLKA